MKLLTSILLLISLTNYSQELRLSKPNKIIITSIGVSTSFYSILKPGCTKSDMITTGAGALFALIPYLVELPSYMEVNSSGINFKLKFDNKYRKCKKLPYKS